MGLFETAGEVDAKKLTNELSRVLCDDEEVVRGFRFTRDLFVMTNKRVILIDKQGWTGSKAEYLTIPYKSITRFSVESSGSFDGDAEIKLWLSGTANPIEKEIKKGIDVILLQKTLAKLILG